LKTKLLLATQNQGKIREFGELLVRTGLSQSYHLLSLQDIDSHHPEVSETGKSFEDNARIKAQAYGHSTGVLTLADDSGLQVTALKGFPGIHSARWLDGSDDQRNQALLKKMFGLTNRTAHFVCSLCLFSPQQKKDWLFEGRIQGEIANQPVGNQGFGYDPIFIPQNFHQTFAQLGGKIKNHVSHRAVALGKLTRFLSKENDLR